MGFLRNIWDGLMSLGAAAVTVVMVGVPLWCAHLAISASLFAPWAYAPMAGLFFVGGIMVMAFVRKAANGVGPLRERRR